MTPKSFSVGTSSILALLIKCDVANTFFRLVAERTLHFLACLGTAIRRPTV